MIKQELAQKQQQKLSPLQIQTIKLIETPLLELSQKVKDEFDNNPVLDDDHSSDGRDSDDDDQPKDVSLDEMKDDDPIPGYRLSVKNWGNDERPEYNTFSVKESFHQSLEEQLGFRHLTPHQREVAMFIIGSLDEDGYLRRDLDSLVDDMAFRAGIETDYEEVESMLKIIQEFDPAGVGARDLRECLLLQLKAAKPSPENNAAILILEKYFDEFANKHFQKILTRSKMSAEQLKAAVARIIKLNPSPGGQIDDSYSDQAQQIVPDFMLDLVDGQLVMTMPRFNIPEVKVKRKYSDMLQTAKYSDSKEDKEAASFVKQKIDSAKRFVEALKQRFNTLETTMNAIIEFQHDVVNSKYIETHFGVFPLKYFFSEGLENKEGEEVSTRELKKALTECVEHEDKRRPLTDDQLVEQMSARGYKVARRTIAKYRDQLGIPMARLRKEL